MPEAPKAPQPAADQSYELAKLRKENAELTAKNEAFQREAELMRAALDTARDEGKLGGLPKGAVQLAESFTVIVEGPKDKDNKPTTKPVDARPGDILLPPGANLDAIKKRMPAGVRVFVVPAEVIDEVRDRKLARA